MTTSVEQNVNSNSRPSDLRITDMRIANVLGPMRSTLIRIDTNQGISGYGEVRDGASKTFALLLKSRIIGENPCNVDKIFRKIKQFGHHARQAGGVCGIEMALMDLAGKAYGVPAYQLAGGKFRDEVLCYCDTPTVANGPQMGQRLKERMEMGFKFLKMDVGIGLLTDVPGALSAPPNMIQSREIMHPFTGTQITPKGIDTLAQYVSDVRDVIGYEIPLAVDHFGHIGVEASIRLGQALDPFTLAWLEDMIPWQLTDQWKRLTDALTNADLHRRGHLSQGRLLAPVRGRSRQRHPPRPGQFRRHSGDQEDRRSGPGARHCHGHAYGGHAHLCAGQCPLRRRHRELPGAGEPLGRRPAVE